MYMDDKYKDPEPRVEYGEFSDPPGIYEYDIPAPELNKEGAVFIGPIGEVIYDTTCIDHLRMSK